jgi:hypothetical protein
VAAYTLRQLEYFVAVAESGSITGAAAQVHLSQSAMSTALADLERALDVRGLAYTLLNQPSPVATSLDGYPVMSVPLDGGTPLEVVLVTTAGSRATRRAAEVAAPEQRGTAPPRRPRRDQQYRSNSSRWRSPACQTVADVITGYC